MNSVGAGHKGGADFDPAPPLRLTIELASEYGRDARFPELR